MNKLRSVLTGGVCAAMFASMAPVMAQDTRVDNAMDRSADATAQAERSQSRIDNLDGLRAEKFADYRGVVQEIDRWTLNVERLEVYLRGQANDIADKRAQIENVDAIVAELEPMLHEMVDQLAAFIEVDVPFLIEERRNRIARLRETLDAYDVTAGEKYRQILNAYGIEADYGRFVRTWEAEMPELEGSPMVDYVSYGRVAWVYLTKDESEAWMWDRDTESWEQLPGSFIPDIRLAMRIAQDKASQDIYRGPVPGPTRADAIAN